MKGDGKNDDITVEAGGSGFGIEQIADGLTNIGNASKDPYETVMTPEKQGDTEGKFRQK
jgi:ABC-type phosphate transport system substrate-binding protein